MATRFDVLIVGETVLIEGVALSLMEQHMLSVHRANPRIVDIRACAAQANPDVIIFELGCPQSAAILALLYELPGTLLMGMDLPGDRAIVMNSRACTPRNMLELRQVFESVRGEVAHAERSTPAAAASPGH